MRRNLEAKKKANEKFIKLIDAEKIKKAWSSNVRETTIDKIVIGDDVYYKSNASDEWQGPAKVILIDKKLWASMELIQIQGQQDTRYSG